MRDQLGARQPRQDRNLGGRRGAHAQRTHTAHALRLPPPLTLPSAPLTRHRSRLQVCSAGFVWPDEKAAEEMDDKQKAAEQKLRMNHAVVNSLFADGAPMNSGL